MNRLPVSDGKTTIVPTQLVMGTANMERDSFAGEFTRMLDNYTARGGDFIDTARIYCAWTGVWAEEYLGRWLKRRKNRSSLFLSTKGGHPKWGDMSASRINRRSLAVDMENSLMLLNTDYVDIYFLHRDDESLPVSEIMPMLDEFVKAGKTRLLGASNWSLARIIEANEFARQNGLTPFACSQIFFSVATTTPAKYGDETLVCMTPEEYAGYLKLGMPVMAFSAQAKGFFTKYVNGSALTVKITERFVSPENMKRGDEMARICEAHDKTPAQCALAALMQNPLPTFPILGASSCGQLIDALGAADVTLDADEVERLNIGGI